MLTRPVARRVAVRIILLQPVCLVIAACLGGSVVGQGRADVDTSVGDQLLSEYCHAQTEGLSRDALPADATLQDWHEFRIQYRRQLADMLGLDDRIRVAVSVAGITPLKIE